MSPYTIKVFFILVCSCLLMPEITNARINNLFGGLSIREGYDSNIYRANKDEVSGWATSISPTLSFNSQGKNDTLSFSYGPRFSYDHKSKKKHVDHELDLIGDKNFTKTFHAAVRETYIRSSNTYLEQQVLIDQVLLLKDYNKTNRLWTNTVSLQTDYTYGPGGVFRLGYTNHILKQLTTQANNSPNNEYVRHNPSTSLSYRFNNYWGMLASYRYVRGDFDNAPDLETHNPGLRLNYLYSPKTTFFGHYGYSKTDYTGNLRPSNKTQSVGFGTDHEIDPQTNISFFAGFSRADKKTASRDAFNYGLNLTKKLQKGSLRIDGNGGFDQADFDGTNFGLSRYWSLKGYLDYQLTEKSKLNAYLEYRNDKYLNQIPTAKENAYSGGGGYSFVFARWYTISFQYGYLQVNGDNSASAKDYIDHRFYVALGAAKELWRW